MSAIVARRVRAGGITLDAAGMSAQGPRSENQDAFTLEGLEGLGTAALADGMGGERGGRLAADTALEALLGVGAIRSLDAARHAIRAADEAVAHAAQQDPAGREGMGCALALLALATGRDSGPGWVGAYVGDVRILSRSPDGTVRLESRDHTPAYARWEAGEISLDAVTEAEGSNRLQRAVGRGGEADAVWIPLRPGWSYLLASDGVSKAMRLDELGEAMASPDASTACETIRRKVEERGPDDNYTAVVIRALPDDDATVVPTTGPPIFNPDRPVTRTRTSPWGPIALLVALAALAVAGWAAWTGLEARREIATRGELERVQRQVDSLAALLPPPDTVISSETPLSPVPRAGGEPNADRP